MNQRLSPAYLHAFRFAQEFLIFLSFFGGRRGGGDISLFLVGGLLVSLLLT